MRKLFFAFILTFLVLIYRQAIFGDKIVFPSNFLASFYSPWSTQKFPGWEQGIPNRPLGTDMFRFFYPQRSFSNQELKAGRIPLWNQYIFSGNPHLANFQSAVFYPLNGLYLFINQLTAWSILIIIQPFLATIFCFYFLSCFPIKKLAAMLGAFAFGFSGFVVTWSQEAMAVGHSVIWLPLILYGLEKKRFFVTVFALTMSILAGYLQTTFYIFVFAAGYTLYRQVEIKKLILLFALALGLSAIQIAPSLESFSLSARPTATIERVFATYLLPVTHLAKIIAPDIEGNPGSYNYFGRGSYNETVLYVGLVPLIFAVLAVLRKSKEKPVKFFLIASVVSYLLTSDFVLTRWFLHLPLPLIPTFQPSRIFILTTFCLSILSAFGFSYYLESRQKENKTIIYISLVLMTVVLLTLGYYFKIYLYRDFLVAAKNTVLPLAILGIVILISLTKLHRNLSVSILIFLTIISQFYFFNKYLVLGDKQFFYPDNPVFDSLEKSRSFDRFVVFDKPILGNFATQFKLYSPEGYDPIFSKRYGQLLFASQDFVGGELMNDIPRIEVMMSQPEKNPENFRRSRLLSLLGVKNILHFDGQWQFEENKQALPRAFLAQEIVVETSSQKILDKIFDQNFDLLKKIILEENVPNFKDFGSVQSVATITKYEPTFVAIETQSTSSGILFLSDNFYPGWKAEVDSQETKIYRADFSFRAIAVPAGKHKVLFKYEPQSFEIGKTITLASLFLLGGLQLLFFRSPRWGDRFGWKPER